MVSEHLKSKCHLSSLDPSMLKRVNVLTTELDLANCLIAQSLGTSLSLQSWMWLQVGGWK